MLKTADRDGPTRVGTGEHVRVRLSTCNGVRTKASKSEHRRASLKTDATGGGKGSARWPRVGRREAEKRNWHRGCPLTSVGGTREEKSWPPFQRKGERERERERERELWRTLLTSLRLVNLVFLPLLLLFLFSFFFCFFFFFFFFFFFLLFLLPLPLPLPLLLFFLPRSFFFLTESPRRFQSLLNRENGVWSKDAVPFSPLVWGVRFSGVSVCPSFWCC